MCAQIKELFIEYPWLRVAIILLVLFDGSMKLIAMWKAARNSETGWFIVLAILNTIGILPIFYLVMHNKKHRADQSLTAID